MDNSLSKIFDKVISAGIVFLTLALVWFSFVYYPRVLNQFRAQPSQVRGLVGNVEASSKGLPYESSHFRIEYQANLNVYLVTISAKTAEQYSQYKIEADLTLKNILSADNLCGLNVSYISNWPFSDPRSSQGIDC